MMRYFITGQYLFHDKVRNIIESAESVNTGAQEISETESLTIMKQYEDEDKILELKQKLSETDYIACKIAEGAATVEEYAAEIAQRQAWRDEINRLEVNV